MRVEDAPGRGSSEATIAHPTAPTRAKLYDHFPQASRSKGIAPKPETAPRLTAPSLPPRRLSWFLRLLVILGHQGSVCAAPPVWRGVPCHQDRTEQILIQPSRVVQAFRSDVLKRGYSEMATPGTEVGNWHFLAPKPYLRTRPSTRRLVLPSVTPRSLGPTPSHIDPEYT